MKRCSYCGGENPDDATVCAIDHQPLASDPAVPPAKPSPADIRAHLALRPPEVKFSVCLLTIGVLLQFFREIMVNSLPLFGNLGFYFSSAFATFVPLVILYFVFRGKDWARRTVVVLLALSLILSTQGGRPDANFYLNLWINFIAVAALFQRASNQWFTALRRTVE